MSAISNDNYRNRIEYNASLTREQFLFYEMRTTSKLVLKKLPKTEIIDKIINENLFQYPTEKSLKSMANCCLKRIELLNNEELLNQIATAPTDSAKQVCLYAMMKHYKIVWDFMISVIGNKYYLMDTSFGKIDINSFFLELQEQNNVVSTWSDSTIKKIKQILIRILVENNYLDNKKSIKLNKIIINPILEHAIREEHNEIALAAFNCLE